MSDDSAAEAPRDAASGRWHDISGFLIVMALLLAAAAGAFYLLIQDRNEASRVEALASARANHGAAKLAPSTHGETISAR